LFAHARDQSSNILLEKLDMNIERAKWIADFMRQAGQKAFQQIALLRHRCLAGPLSQRLCQNAIHDEDGMRVPSLRPARHLFSSRGWGQIERMKLHPADLSALKVVASGRSLLIGHRGCARWRPENTLPSFRFALEAVADLVELDFRETKDGELVVMHDRDLDRTTDAMHLWGKKRVAVDSRTAAEIQTLDAGSWFHQRFAGTRVPLLKEALDTIYPGAIPVLEHKSGDPQTVIKLLRAKRLVSKVVLLSFNWAFLRQAHHLEPGLVLGALGPPSVLPDGRKPRKLLRLFVARWLKPMRETGAKIIVWNKRVSRHSVKVAHDHRLKVWIYTVNSTKLMKRLLATRVDGIITDDPLLMKPLVPYWGL